MMATAATAIITFLSAPTPRQVSACQQGCSGQTLFFAKSTLIRRIRLSSSSSLSSSSVTVEEEEEEDSDSPPSPDNGLPIQSEHTATQDFDALPSARGCKACGREELEKGCNGEGRIQGGIATVPGFGWWPIKAYRPCPGFVASGGRYRRQGQSMDEVAFGRGEKGVPIGSTDEAQSRKKKQGPTKFKR